MRCLQVLFLAGTLAGTGLAQQGFTDTPFLPGQKWRVHDKYRPQPRVVAPGYSPVEGATAPSDAIVLFDGEDLSKWTQGKNPTPRWKVENGYFEIVGRTGGLRSKEKFGDAQIHVEWLIPSDTGGKGQGRGNSGVIIMSQYEIQVLDSYQNETYADGMAGAIYGQWPPLVNSSRKNDEWQSFDIVFEAPRFDGENVVRPAYVTVLHNGVMIHNRREIMGGVVYKKVAKYRPHGVAEPLGLQDHGMRVRYRNIWVRRLTETGQQANQ